jgi:hypothetical protein
MDRANDTIRQNPVDKAIAGEGIPVVIKTPSGDVKRFDNGRCGSSGCVLIDRSQTTTTRK